MAVNKFRKEAELILNGHSYSVRPTFDKMARIESTFGPAVVLMRRVGDGNVTQAELTRIVQIMLRGVANAPREADLPPLIFDQGTMSVAGNIVTFLVNGITTSDAVPPSEDEEQAANPT
jgi:hypothetical protein